MKTQRIIPCVSICLTLLILSLDLSWLGITWIKKRRERAIRSLNMAVTEFVGMSPKSSGVRIPEIYSWQRDQLKLLKKPKICLFWPIKLKQMENIYFLKVKFLNPYAFGSTGEKEKRERTPKSKSFIVSPHGLDFPFQFPLAIGFSLPFFEEPDDQLSTAAAAAPSAGLLH